MHSTGTKKILLTAKAHELTMSATVKAEQPTTRERLEILKAKLEYREALYQIRQENHQERTFHGVTLPGMFFNADKSASNKLAATQEMLEEVNNALGLNKKPSNMMANALSVNKKRNNTMADEKTCVTVSGQLNPDNLTKPAANYKNDELGKLKDEFKKIAEAQQQVENTPAKKLGS